MSKICENCQHYLKDLVIRDKTDNACLLNTSEWWKRYLKGKNHDIYLKIDVEIKFLSNAAVIKSGIGDEKSHLLLYHRNTSKYIPNECPFKMEKELLN